MPRYDKNQDHRKPRYRKTSRPETLGPRETARRVHWLTGIPVYWSGSVDRDDSTALPFFGRFVKDVIADKLQQKAPGLYTIELTNPLAATPVGRIKQVTAKELSAAMNFITRLETGHYDLSCIAPKPSQWLETIKTRHHGMALAFRGLNASGDEPYLKLALEVCALWIGNDADRPGNQLSSDDLHTACDDRTVPELARAAAFFLGQRKKNTIPDSLKKWQMLGRHLPEWDSFAFTELSDKDAGKLCHRLSGNHLGHSVWGDAVVEYRLWHRTNPPDIGGFIEGLQACVTRAEHVKRRTDERGSRLLWCVGEAMQDVEAFTKLKGAAGYSWNHEFMAVCRDKLKDSLSLRLPFLMTAAGITGGLQGIFRWFLGIELRDIDLMRLKKIQAVGESDPNYQFMRRLEEIIRKRLVPDHTRQTRILAAAVGKLGVSPNPHDRLDQIARWLEHCSTICLPGPEGDGPLMLAVQCLFNTFQQVESDSERNRITAIAADHGDDILHLLEHRLALILRPPSYGNLIPPLTQTKENYENVLLLLASLPNEYRQHIPWLLSEQLTTWLNHIVSQKPDRLALAMDFLTKVDSTWLNLSPSETVTWVTLANLENDHIAEKLLCWTHELHDKKLLNWETIDLIASDLLRFITHGNTLKRQTFLADNSALLDTIVTSALSAIDTGLSRDFDVAFGERLYLLELSYYWSMHFGKADEFLNRLLNRIKHLNKSGDPIDNLVSRDGCESEMAVLLSDGKLGRLLNILKNRRVKECTYNADPVIAWNWLKRFPEILQFLSESTQNSDLMPGIVKFLQQTDLALRLQSRKELVIAFKAWCHNRPLDRQNPPGITADMVPQDCLDELMTLLIHKQRAGGAPELPAGLQKIINQPLALKKELSTLTRKMAETGSTRTVSLRMDKIRTYLDDADALDEWIQHNVKHEITKQLQYAKLNHLNHITQRAVSDYWVQLCGSTSINTDAPEWVNALMIYLSTTHNKRLLKDLIRQLAQGTPLAEIKHPVNTSFLKDLEPLGISAEQWTNALTQTIAFNGQSFEVSIEKDPLRILQMGTIFGTCLRAGGDHSYAAIANAIEVNKALITITNPSGEMVGRKLLALSRDGVLFGFRSYGKGPMCKAVTDAMARSLADRCGARLANSDDIRSVTPGSFKLFAEWYNDGAESYDPWLLEPHPTEFATQLIQSRLDELLYENRMMAARACIYLGDSARAILDNHPTDISPSFYTQCFGSGEELHPAG